MLSQKIDNRIPWKLCICCNGEFAGEVINCPSDGTVLKLIKSDSLVGTILADKYEILEVIGGGGMGVVYKGKHRLLNRSVAIKVLHKKQLTDAVGLKRFQLEGQAASSLSSPHIVTIFDFGASQQGLPFMVMDYLNGQTLSQVLEAQGRLSVERAVPIFIQICSALAHAHGKGIIHRDVKPSNIMLIDLEEHSDFVKIVDFGIAKLQSRCSESRKLTRTGELFGSALYMSPEQCQGEKLDSRADIYSLGSVMYQVITGKPMFVEKDILQMIYRHVMETPASFQSVSVSVPAELEEIVFKALAKDKEERYQSMHELMMALESFSKRLRTHRVGVDSYDTLPILDNGQQNTDKDTNTAEIPHVPVSVVEPAMDLSQVETQNLAPLEITTIKPREETIQIVIEKRKIAAAGIIILLFSIGGTIGFFLASPLKIVSEKPTVLKRESPKKAQIVAPNQETNHVPETAFDNAIATPDQHATAERHAQKRTRHKRLSEVTSGYHYKAHDSAVSPITTENPLPTPVAPMASTSGAAPEASQSEATAEPAQTAGKHRFAGLKHALRRLIPKL